MRWSLRENALPLQCGVAGNAHPVGFDFGNLIFFQTALCGRRFTFRKRIFFLTGCGGKLKRESRTPGLRVRISKINTLALQQPFSNFIDRPRQYLTPGLISCNCVLVYFFYPFEIASNGQFRDQLRARSKVRN